MSFNSRDIDGTKANEREELLKKFLPDPTGPRKQHTGASKSREATTVTGLGIRQALREHVYGLVYTLIHAVFSVYVRVRIAYRAVALRTVSVLYYHHRTPEYIRRDVHSLPRLPKHVSVILNLEEGGKRSDAKEKLISEVADIASWCASAGIGMLSVYERSGVLKHNMESSHRKVSSKLRDWFGKYQAPDLHLHAPNSPVIHPSYYSAPGRHQEAHHGMSVMLISAEDGRESMVDLTKVLTQMAQRSKLSTADITTDVIDSELTNSVMNEPDLLISFAPFVDLQGYPPWQIRLTELYCEKDNQNGVEYQVFLNGLRKYAAATFKLGK